MAMNIYFIIDPPRHLLKHLLKSVVSFERSHASVKLTDIKLITNSSQLKEL